MQNDPISFLTVDRIQLSHVHDNVRKHLYLLCFRKLLLWIDSIVFYESLLYFHVWLIYGNMYRFLHKMHAFSTTIASFLHELHVLSTDMPHMRPETLNIYPQIPQSDLRNRSRWIQVVPKRAKGPPKGPPRTPQDPLKSFKKEVQNDPGRFFEKRSTPKRENAINTDSLE